MKNIYYFIFFLSLVSCKVEKLLDMAEKKDKTAVMNRGENLAEATRSTNWPDTLKHELKLGSYEYEMQERFKIFSSNTCNCIPENSNLNKRDFIPKNFRSINPSPYFERNIEKADRISSLALFYYPFSKDQIIEFDKIKFDQSKILFTDYYDLTIPIEADNNFTNFFYSSSCSNYLFSSIDASVNSPVPIASIKAGLKSDNDKQATLICIGGNFKSPLLNELLSSNNEIKTNIYFKLWDYYSKLNSDTVLYVLKNFEGVSFNTTLSTNNSFLVNTNGQLNLSSGFASVASNMEAGKSKTTFFKGTNWTTLIDKEDFIDEEHRFQRFQVLPSPTLISLHFIKNVKKLSNSNSYDNMFQNYEHTHFSIYRGIPETDRNSDDWEIITEKNIYRSPPTLEIDKNHLPMNECKFIIRGIPSDNLFSSEQNNTVDFSYKIQKKNKIFDKVIALNSDNILLTINKEPLVYDRTVTTTASEFSVNEIGDNITYKWTFNVRLLDSKNLVRYDKIPSTTCNVITRDSNGSFAFVGNVSPIASNKDFIFTISSTVPKGNLDRNRLAYTSANVKFDLFINQQAVERSFNVDLPIYSITSSE